MFRNYRILIFITIISYTAGAAVSPAKHTYVGCYEDEHLGGIHLFTKRVKITGVVSLDNPKPCIDECIDADYSFAGLNYKECFCSHEFPSEIAKTSDHDCDSNLADKSSSGPFSQGRRLSVYETGINKTIDLRPTRVYIGCYREDNNKVDRLLKGSWTQLRTENSPERCHQICLKTGFRYFGLTYREECFCGDSRPSEDLLTDESDCSMSCSGDPAAKCGGGWLMSAYATGIIDIPSDNRYVGCYKNTEDDGSFNYKYNIVLKVANSPRRCLSVCDQLGYKFSGVQNRDKCYCGNKKPLDEFLADNRHCNNLICPGDATDTCGSRSHVKLYHTRHEEHKDVVPSEYLGCYKDQHDNPILQGSRVTYPHSLTPEICVDTCKQRGFPFAGLKFGKHCLCDHYFPSSLSKTSEDSCKVACSGDDKQFCGGSSRLSVYQTGLPRSGVLPSNIYLGCFRDDDPANRMLKGTWQELDNNTPRVCQKLCYRTGYPVFGLTYRRECFCGTQNPSDELLLDELECNVACAGDSNLKCGGGWRTSIYRTGLTDKSISSGKYLGCYNDLAGTTLLADFTLTLSRSNTPSRCWNICDQLGYLYTGIERGVECYCGNQEPDASSKESEESCNSKCPGDDQETCGRQNKMRIFRTSVPGNTTFAQYVLSYPPLLTMSQKPSTIKCVDTSEVKSLTLAEIQKLVYAEHLRLIRLKTKSAQSTLLQSDNASHSDDLNAGKRVTLSP